MDKYEFNIKVEQIKKMVTRGDFETSMKIADTIDWRRVRSANLLSMISQVYEKNGEYQEAKEVLLLAYERAPIGKRLLFKLTELALKEGSIREAEDYYREFCDLAQDDPRQYLLRYLILKEKKAPGEQLITCLEHYVSQELDERWMYELASLYEKNGQQHKCVQMCDRIMLMFAFGKYVDKAMDLKVRYAPLSEYQLDLMKNKDKYEAKLKVVEQKFDEDTLGGFDEDIPSYTQESYSQESYSREGYPQAEYPGQPYSQGTYIQEEDSGQPYAQEGYAQAGYPGQPYGQAGYAPSENPGQPYTQAGYIPAENAGQLYGQGGYIPSENPGQPYGQAGYVPSENPGQLYTQAGYIPAENAGQLYGQGGYIPSENAGQLYGQAGYIPAENPGQPYAQAGYIPAENAGQPYAQAGYAPSEDSGQPYVQDGYAQTGYPGQPYAQAGYVPSETLGQPYAQAGYAPSENPSQPYTQGGYAPAENAGQPYAQAGYTQAEKSGQPYTPGGYAQQGYPAQPYSQEEYPRPENSGQLYIQDEYAPAEQQNRPYSQEAPAQNPYIPEGYPRVNIPQEQYPQEGRYQGQRYYFENENQEFYGEEEGDTSQDVSGFPEATISDEPIYANTEERSGTIDEELVVNLHQDNIEQELAKEMSKMSEETFAEEEPISMQTKVPGAGQDNIFQASADDPKAPPASSHLLIQANTPKKGLEAAIKVLKQIHMENGSSNQVAKITGSKLNQKGILNIADMLAGKDLVVEEAEDLSKEEMADLQQLASEDTSGMNIILIDNSRQLEALHQQNPEMTSLFECISAEEVFSPEPLAEEAEEAEDQEQTAQEPALSADEEPEESSPVTAEEEDKEAAQPVGEEAEPAQEEPEAEAETELGEEPENEFETEPDFESESGFGTQVQVETEPEYDSEPEEEYDPEFAYEQEPENEVNPEDDEEMELDDFADYATKYASEIDCSITGKSVLALYERIEVMAEDGIPLTKANAEELIEEAADRAEKPPLGKLIKGMFTSKYDKEGLLILREEHFI